MKSFAEPFRLDRNRTGAVMMIYIRDDIPSRLYQNMFFQVSLKVYSRNSNLGNVNVTG